MGVCLRDVDFLGHGETRQFPAQSCLWWMELVDADASSPSRGPFGGLSVLVAW